MSIVDKSDTEIISIADPIWQNLVKSSKAKVQASINGDEVRITGKKRDDLQSMIELLKSSDIKIPLQFQNFRD